MESPEKPRYFRKILKVSALASPNVRLALAEIAQGKEPSGKIILPGVLPWADYAKRRATWDKVRQCIGLDAEFYEGASVLLYPPDALNRCEDAARKMKGKSRKGRAIGMDPAEGGDSSAWSVVDEFGLILLMAAKTPDTNVIPSTTLALMRQFGVPPEKVCFDRGGGGKQHADRLRSMGYNVTTVGFGESVSLEPKRGTVLFDDARNVREERGEYFNRRAEMYGGLMDRVADPENPFTLPEEYHELRRQMSLIPKERDEHGRLKIRSKGRRPGQQENNLKTLTEILGCSPDELDSLVIAEWKRTDNRKEIIAGAI